MAAKTWEVLATLGFEETPDEWSSGHRYELDLGLFRLKAAQRTNQYYREVIAFSGDYSTTRNISTISFDLLPDVASPDHCKAFIAYYLRHYANVEGFIAPEWLREGRELARLLPWQRGAS